MPVLIPQEVADNSDHYELFEDVQRAVMDSLAKNCDGKTAAQWATAYMLGDIAETLREIRNYMREQI